jgi:hypothetical protein
VLPGQPQIMRDESPGLGRGSGETECLVLDLGESSESAFPASAVEGALDQVMIASRSSSRVALDVIGGCRPVGAGSHAQGNHWRDAVLAYFGINRSSNDGNEAVTSSSSSSAHRPRLLQTATTTDYDMLLIGGRFPVPILE